MKPLDWTETRAETRYVLIEKHFSLQRTFMKRSVEEAVILIKRIDAELNKMFAESSGYYYMVEQNEGLYDFLEEDNTYKGCGKLLCLWSNWLFESGYTEYCINIEWVIRNRFWYLLDEKLYSLKCISEEKEHYPIATNDYGKSYVDYKVK